MHAFNGAVTYLKAAIAEYPATRQPGLSKLFMVYSKSFLTSVPKHNILTWFPMLVLYTCIWS